MGNGSDQVTLMDINPVTLVEGLSFTMNRQQLNVRKTVLLNFMLLIRWVRYVLIR